MPGAFTSFAVNTRDACDEPGILNFRLWAIDARWEQALHLKRRRSDGRTQAAYGCGGAGAGFGGQRHFVREGCATRHCAGFGNIKRSRLGCLGARNPRWTHRCGVFAIALLRGFTSTQLAGLDYSRLHTTCRGILPSQGMNCGLRWAARIIGAKTSLPRDRVETQFSAERPAPRMEVRTARDRRTAEIGGRCSLKVAA